ncbi:methyl-accepting chemotaxis protein [Balneatrix alpica]|uniref:Methyl-accepting chemotaxis protein n=1 Tax=Balneatrix alpica TaxID=75684 RepID=A0ABV5ZBC9_9GAMM|nr:methyl-accepting chemotaxis protein [Balneatrix alpica]
MTLKKKLLIFVALVIFVVTGLLTGSAYWQFKGEMETSVTHQVAQTSLQASQRIGEWLQSKKHIVAGMAKAAPEPSNILPVIQQGQISGGFDITYLAFSDGSVTFSDPNNAPPAGYDPRQRPWYKLAMDKGQLAVTDPYVDATSGDLVITIVQPAKDPHSNRDAVYAGDVFTRVVAETVLSISLGEQGAAALVNAQGAVMAYKNKDFILKPVDSLLQGLSAGQLPTLSKAERLQSVSLAGEHKLAKVTQVPNSDWYLVVFVDPEEVFAPLARLLQSALLISVVVFVVFILLASAGLGSLLRPLNAVAEALHDIAKGEGDLTKRLSVGSRDELGRIAQNFNTFMDHIQPIMQRISQSIGELRSEARSGNANADRMTREVQEQQGEITQVATAMHEMAMAANEVAQHAEETAHAARLSAQAGEQGMSVVQRNRDSIVSLAKEIDSSTTIINELDRHAQDISSILATIQGIAEQTNLLALNAAIEAARAGEQGRGFAVVADEVRVLSQRTHSSTEEIQHMIEQLQSTTRRAVQHMERSGQLASGNVQDAELVNSSLQEITDSIRQISDRAVQIASAAEEQKAVSDDISRNTTAIKEVADQLADVAQAGHAGAQKLSQVAEALQKEVSNFKL